MLASIFSLNVIQTALELGCIYALVALALFLSYSILNIADLSTDGCFTLGCAVACQVALTGHPFLALLAAMAAGVCSGFITAFLQTRLGVESIMAGIITVITRLVNNWVFIRFVLATSNRSSSCFSRLKARITGIPVRISLDTRFSRSTRSCIFLNFGMAMDINRSTSAIIEATATTIIQLMPVFVCSTLNTPPIPMIGA